MLTQRSSSQDPSQDLWAGHRCTCTRPACCLQTDRNRNTQGQIRKEDLSYQAPQAVFPWGIQLSPTWYAGIQILRFLTSAKTKLWMMQKAQGKQRNKHTHPKKHLQCIGKSPMFCHGLFTTDCVLGCVEFLTYSWEESSHHMLRVQLILEKPAQLTSLTQVHKKPFPESKESKNCHVILNACTVKLWCESKIHYQIILELWLTTKNTRRFDQLCLVFLVEQLVNFPLENMSGKRHIS